MAINIAFIILMSMIVSVIVISITRAFSNYMAYVKSDEYKEYIELEKKKRVDKLNRGQKNG